MNSRRFSHVIGFDDAPFSPEHRGGVLVVGAVFGGARLEGVLSGKVRRDGANSTRVLRDQVSASRFHAHLKAVLLQGITFAGFNVVDIGALSEGLGLPVLSVCRRRPDFAAIRRALMTSVPGGRRKWALVEKAGPVDALGGVYVQRVGLSVDEAGEILSAYALNGMLPEPLRTAHIIAGGIADGESRHRA